MNIWPDRAAVVADALGQNLLQDDLCAMSFDQSLHVELSCAPAFVAVHPQRQLMLHQMTQRASHSAACCFHNRRHYRKMARFGRGSRLKAFVPVGISGRADKYIRSVIRLLYWLVFLAHGRRELVHHAATVLKA